MYKTVQARPIVSSAQARQLLVLTPLLALSASASYAQTSSEPAATTAPATVQAAPAATDGTTGQAAPEEAKAGKKRWLPPIGPEVEVVYLMDSKTKSKFGSTITSIGPGIGSIMPPMKGKIRPNFSLLQAKKSQNGQENKLFALSIGPEYRSVYIPGKFRDQMGGPEGPGGPGGQDGAGGSGGPGGPGGPDDGGGPPPFMPYYGIGLDAIYAKVKVPSENVDGSGFGVGGAVTAGVAIKQHFLIEARARVTSKVKGYGFTGVGLTFGMRF